MNLGNSENLISESANVLSLYSHVEEVDLDDPLEALLHEAGVPEDDEEEVSASVVQKALVLEHHAPDVGLYIIEEQLSQLRSRLHRIKFYLNEINDLIPG